MSAGRAAAGTAALPTVGTVIREIARRFRSARLAYGHGTLGAREEAAWLVLHVCRLPFESLPGSEGRPVTPAQSRRIEKMARRRVGERIPIAYLTREAWLGDFRFYVDRRTIVPRSLIAELLPEGLAPFMRRPPRTCLDLCTGSGCLAVLAAHAFPRATVDAVDLSKAALAVAKRNVAAYRMTRRIRLVASDLFSALAGGKRYDLIVSNPPYVNAASMSRLPAEYLAEPRMALAGGHDGISLVRRIIEGARERLATGGILVCEIGHNRRALERAYPRTPFTWLETSGGDGLVFLIEREQLPH